jgi:hypothetical protein
MASQTPDAVYEVEFVASDDLARALIPQAACITVYAFELRDDERGTPILFSRMATRATIENLHGQVKEETAWVVESSAVDADGFYSPISAGPPFKVI